MQDSLKALSNILAAVVHLVFSLLTAVLLLVYCCRKSRTRCLFIRFYGHVFTWAITMVVAVILIFEILEGVLSDVKSSAFHLDVHLCNFSALLASCFVLVLYNHAENQRRLAYLIPICTYWFLGAVVRAMNLAALVGADDSHDRRVKESAKFLLICLVVLFYVVLGISTVVVLIKQNLRRSHPTGRRSTGSSEVKEDDLSSVLYIHSYVCLLSKILLHWFNDILFTGYRKSLTTEDLGKIPLKDSSQVNYEKLKALFEEEKRQSYVDNRSPSLFRCFWRMTKGMMLLSGSFKLLSDLLIYVPPLCLDVIVNYLLQTEDQGQDDGGGGGVSTTPMTNITESMVSVREFFMNGYIVTVLCFLVLVVQMTLFQQHLFVAIRQGIRCKCALQAMVFDKSLRLYVSTINEGRLMNHMTVDPLHVVMLYTFAHSIWTMPIQVSVGLVMLYIQLGTSALISGLLILLMVIIQYIIGQRLGVTQEKIMEQSDQRLKQSNEMLQSIKLLKLYAWERVFYESVVVTRAKELRLMLTASILRTLSISVTDGVPYFACFLTFTLYHYLESEPLNAGKVFSGLALFAIFGSQLFIITLMINVASQARISVTRLRDFLLLSEVAKQPVLQDQQQQANGVMEPSVTPPVGHISTEETASLPLQQMAQSPTLPADDSALIQLDARPHSSEFAIEIVDGNFCATDSEQILFDINLKIPAGKLTMVIGSVGSGKSSLLWAILGELRRLSGEVTYGSRSFGFVPQSSWIMNSTVRENITFGLPFDEVRYKKVIKVAGLEPDLETFPGGDQAEIGEKGANLSGGQRQRVSIARALYSDSQIYLMDDPLSALDAQVSSRIFEEAVLGSLIGHQKTVILVTHHVHLLPRADHLIVMKSGRVFYEGPVTGILSEGSPLPLDFQNKFGESRNPERKGRISLLPVDGHLHDVDPFSHPVKHRMSVGIKGALSYTTLSMLSDDIEFADAYTEKSNMDSHQPIRDVVPDGEIGRLIEKEELSVGAVPCRYFIAYFRAATWLLSTLALSFYASRLAIRMAGDFWLTKIIDVSNEEKGQHPPLDTTDHPVQSNMNFYIVIYCILSMIAISFVPFGTMFLELTALTASRNLHHRMLQQVILAPLRFFDTNPIGRIVNRLSSDMNVIDEKLVIIYDALLFCSLAVLGGILMNSIFVPYFIIPVVPILILFVSIQRFCITSCRELQRLDCNTKSPILAHFSQILAGLATVRAYRCERRFQLENFQKIDSNNVAFLFFNTCHLWLGLRLDYLGSLLVLAASLSAITTCLLGVINAATVGLVVSYAIMISSLLNWTMRNFTEMEVYFGSVERVIQYGAIESEPYERSRGPLPPEEWPSEGEIEFQAVSLQYSPELDPVVRNFSLVIKPGKKVGICGRTGSGKSSLTLSMFRMVNISEGRILLDGIDISDVPLQLLRSKLSIIPQDPVLFSGTVRFNLDPLKTKSDAEIWDVLKISQLLELVLKLPEQLDTTVSEGGDNMSVGQRQLFCLARALLRNSKVLIMDEATASVDPDTDRLIQKIVKMAFVQCTVVTIAHRLSTIKNCDLVVVLKDGQKIEEGRPDDLIARNGAFAQMLAENQL